MKVIKEVDKQFQLSEDLISISKELLLFEFII